MKDIHQIIENPEIFRINRLDAHSDHQFYQSENPLHISLNGDWKFCYSENIDKRPVDFYKTDYDTSGFDTIPVPSHIQLQGYDKIHYINTMYPWDGVCDLRPPFVDREYNPVGSYVTFFDIPDFFKEKKVCISFKGVEQGFSLWLNGHYIGYSEDTFTPSDFDLTEFVQEKNNKLAVEVYKKTSASWIEDQDFFRFSGIFRDVVLYAKTPEHIEDIWVVPTLCEDLTTGDFSFKVKMSPETHVKFKIYNQENCVVLEDSPTLTLETLETAEIAENKHQYFVTKQYGLSDLTLWDINAPYLYTLEITTFDKNGNLSEIAKTTFGFRLFTIKNSVMYLNNKRLIINGVNRHEWNPKKGRAIDSTDMMADIEVFKRNNISAVRTSHYPNQSMWYSLCDQNGIIVMDEANLESHGSWQKMGQVEPSWNVPGCLAKWRNVVVDRAVSMFERDKNHPSILWWSCGNESYGGECILAMANYFRSKDSSRFVHYEGCFYTPEFSNITDIYSRMYPTPEEIAEYIRSGGTDKPYILCEYMHNMGNSLGGMESYIKLLDEFENYQGGFIWDYMDQAIYQTVNGKEVLCYGGDFADRPTDYNFSGNGIVFANRAEKPAMQEVKYWYDSPENRKKHDLENAENMDKLKTDIATSNSCQFEVIKGDINLGVKGENFKFIFAYDQGGPVSIVYDDVEWLYRAAKPTYWRAITENDNASGFAQKSGLWNYADMYSRHTADIKVNTDVAGQVTISYIYDTFIGTTASVDYTVFSNGVIKVCQKLIKNESLPSLPLFGTNFILDSEILDFSYLGYSGETYSDRFKGGRFALHNEKVSTTDYLMPQENGGHFTNYELTLSHKSGNKLKFTYDSKPFHFSINHNTAQELENATHKHELANTGRTNVKILSHVRGVGGINTWGADVEQQYHINPTDNLELSFFIWKG